MQTLKILSHQQLVIFFTKHNVNIIDMLQIFLRFNYATTSVSCKGFFKGL